MKFFQPYDTEAKRLAFAKERLIDLKIDEQKVEVKYTVDMEKYHQGAKAWEIKSVRWAYQAKFGVFPPELKTPGQLGDKDIEENDTDTNEKEGPAGSYF